MPWNNNKWYKQTEDEEFSWDGAPEGLKELWLYNNKLESYSGENKPENCEVYGVKIVKKIDWNKFKTSKESCMICHLNDDNEDPIDLGCTTGNQSAHSVHKKCIEEWFKSCKNHKCPLCDKEIFS